MKVLHSICQQIWKTQQWPQDWKRPIFIPIPRKGSGKECSNYQTLSLISQVNKVIHKIFKARFQQYFQMYKLDLEKTEEPEIKLPTFIGIYRKQGNSRKASTSVSLTKQKPLTVWIRRNYGRFLKRWEYHTILPAF